jgi:hypothetical protein
MEGCASARTSIPTLSLTFAHKKCAYRGPKRISGGVFMLNVFVPRFNTPWSEFALVTLNSGKSIADLQAWPSTELPAWVTSLAYQDAITMDRSFPLDLSKEANWHPEEPLYFVCFQMDSNGIIQKIGAFGPIEVRMKKGS